jgi:hypothetical protein
VFEDDEDWRVIGGEYISIAERLVLSPCQGRLKRIQEVVESQYTQKGQIVARVVNPEGKVLSVRTGFSGQLGGFLVPDAAPVRRSEPVAWLRCAELSDTTEGLAKEGRQGRRGPSPEGGRLCPHRPSRTPTARPSSKVEPALQSERVQGQQAPLLQEVEAGSRARPVVPIGWWLLRVRSRHKSLLLGGWAPGSQYQTWRRQY